MNKLEAFCNAQHCKSKIKIIRSALDIRRDHNDHIPNIKTFEELSEELHREDHPLRKFKMTQDKVVLNSYIDKEIQKLFKTFELVLNNLKNVLKNLVSSHDQSLQDLMDLYHAILEQNDTKIEKLQYAIPLLSISSDEIARQEGMAAEIRIEIDKVLIFVNETIQAIPKSTLIDPTLGIKAENLIQSNKIQLYASEIVECNLQQTPTGDMNSSKKAENGKTKIIFNVKVYEAEDADLERIAQKCKTVIVMDGLQWVQEHKIVLIAYGAKQLQLSMIVQHDKIKVDDVFDRILAWQDDVQSVDIVEGVV